MTQNNYHYFRKVLIMSGNELNPAIELTMRIYLTFFNTVEMYLRH